MKESTIMKLVEKAEESEHVSVTDELWGRYTFRYLPQGPHDHKTCTIVADRDINGSWSFRETMRFGGDKKDMRLRDVKSALEL